MAYCTKEDVQAEFKQLTYDGGGVISSTAVDDWISQADAYINSKVGLQYVVPVTGTESLKILKSMSIALVAERIRGKLSVKTGKTENDQNSQSTGLKTVNAMLTDIIDQKLLLSDATLVNANSGVSDYNSTHDVKHQFKINQDQW